MNNISRHGMTYLFTMALIFTSCSNQKPFIEKASYMGWPSTSLGNDLVRLQIVPEIGGRVIQYSFDGKDFFFVDSQLAGKFSPPEGVGPGNSWLNYGGDKLWPAPQGRANEEQWAGPPDPILDGSPYTIENLPATNDDVAIRLTSGEDKRSGIQFSRIISLSGGSTHVSFQATMKNIDNKPRRWGIWSHTQLDGGTADGKGINTDLYAYCPINPRSHFPKGYNVMQGDEKNPSFQADTTSGLMQVQYLYKGGKIGMDSHAGWIASVDGTNGKVFVQRFSFEEGKEYPDGASVEFWMNGGRRTNATSEENEMLDDSSYNPYIFESEMISPYAKILPGESYTWKYDWYASTIGGNFKITHCTPAGITAAPFIAVADGGELKIDGRFGVFSPGTLMIKYLDATGKILKEEKISEEVSPLKPIVIDMKMELPLQATSVSLSFYDIAGNDAGAIASAQIRK